MEFRRAEERDLKAMCQITQQAKDQLKRLGVSQWQKGEYPSWEVWERDIKNGMAWLAVEGEQVLGVFAFQTTPDVSYGVIEGAWLTDTPYASMHRVCVSDDSKGKGVAGAMFRHGFAMAKELGFASLRIDTHPENIPMQRALGKAGFVRCGQIILQDGEESGDARVAFEYIL